MATAVARVAPDLPICVIALIDKALAWDRRNRFESAKAMQAAVREALASVESGKALDGRDANVSRSRAPSSGPVDSEGRPPTVRPPAHSHAASVEALVPADDARVTEVRNP